jgi:hypothetical protein
MSRACSTDGDKINAQKILVGKPEGKSPLGRRRRKGEVNNEKDLRDIGWGGMDWINLFQDTDQCGALVNTVINLRGPQNIGKFFSC